MGRSRQGGDEQIVGVLRECPEVVVAYLFGSRAAGRARQDSDVDVAVVFPEALPTEHRFRLRCALSEHLAAACGVETADVIDLERAPPLLAHQVLRDGRLLLTRDEGRRVRVAARQIMRYIDTRPHRRALDDATFRRLKEGSFGRLS